MFMFRNRAWEDITQDQVAKILNDNKDVQLIDVREDYEFEDGHIKGAKSVPLSNFRAKYKEIDPGKETIVVCLSGGRSTSACQFLSSAGYKNIKNMMGGMMSWRGPVER